MVHRRVVPLLFAVCLVGAVARAGTTAGGGLVEDSAAPPAAFTVTLTGSTHDPWHVDWLPALDAAQAAPASPFAALKLTPAAAVSGEQAATAPRPVAYDYSDAYMTRAKIHRYASWATLPLFIANYYAGDQLYDGDFTEGQKSAHSSLVTASAVLFGVNSVTGAWNLWEGRKDPNHRTRRMVHGILMLAADVGFLATGATAPDFEEGKGEDASTHKSLAITSMGIATASYLFMLFSR
jgi:hypothetical protein